MDNEKFSVRLQTMLLQIAVWLLLVVGPIAGLTIGLWQGLWWLLLIVGVLLGGATAMVMLTLAGSKLDRWFGFGFFGTTCYALLTTAVWAGILLTCWPFSQTRSAIYGWICLGIAILNAVFFIATSMNVRRAHG